MRRKLHSRKGETLVEVLVSLLVAVMIIAMLPMALETAAKTNAQVADMKTVCSKTMGEPYQTEVTAKICAEDGSSLRSEDGTEDLGVLNVQGYSEDGFIYYVAK